MIDSSSYIILLAAEGYLELGMLDDAKREFDRLLAEDKLGIDALSVLMRIRRAEGNLGELEAVAERLCIIDSDNVDRWIDLALVLGAENFIESARELLLEALDRFPGTALLHFHLARFECSLGNLALAKEHLHRSKKLCPVCRVLALTDEGDLLPIWADHSASQLNF